MLDEMMFDGSPQTSGVAKSGAAYLLHAVVLEVSGQQEAADSLLMGKLVRRRLNRLERVLGASGGSIVRQMPDGMLAVFDSAEAAVLGACEMQRRCAVIPQLSETQIALKIGIQATTFELLAPAVSSEFLAAGAQLALLLEDACIVISGNVVDALPADMREKLTAIDGRGLELPAFSIDWNAMPMTRVPRAPAPSPQPERVSVAAAEQTAAEPGLELVVNDMVYRFGPEHTVITVGRDPSNDVQIDSIKASRQHCRIISQSGYFTLFDLSTNGTFIRFASGKELFVLKRVAPLSGSGWLSFGHASPLENSLAVAFRVIPGH